MNEPADNNRCPSCGEPVKANWKVCPACETPLGSLSCPRCNMPVNANWKRCPECECRLICKTCGRRIPKGRSSCPDCEDGPDAAPFLGDTLTEPVAGIEFVKVPGGRFAMGDLFVHGLENETPVHEVTLDNFLIAKYPLTQAQWHSLMPDNPSRFKGGKRPLEQVDWDGVQRFIRLLQEKNQDRFRFSLPTEAQWEYAARSGGRDEPFAGSAAADPVAWYEDNSGGETHPVGRKEPNGLGIHDMCGNIWEWCLDVYAEDAYQRLSGQNPLCTAGSGDRVIRGGSWNVDAWSCRCARRMSFPPDFYGPGLGFRLVVTLA